MKWWFNQELYVKIFVCIILGVVLGLTIGAKISFIMAPIGEIFLRLLKMLIAPVIFFTIVSGITKMEDVNNLKSVGSKLLIYYAVTSLLSVVIGLVMALVINPGKDMVGLMQNATKTVKNSDFNFVNNMLSWVPTNPFEALSTANVMQILFFALFLGIVLLMMGERAKTVIKLFDEGSEIMLRITDMVMSFAPYGILALISEMVHSMNAATLAEVGKFILTDYVALFIILLVVYPVQLKLMAKISTTRFYKAISPSILIAASTTSSAATLPVNLNVAEKNLKLPEKIYGFGLTIGATANSNGMACVLGVIIVFAANIFGMNLTLPFIVEFVLVGLLLSMGTAGVKGAGIVLSSIILQTMNLPLTLVPILAAIWPVIDIGHTTVNVVGDMVGVSIIAARSGEMDVDGFNNSTTDEVTNSRPL